MAESYQYDLAVIGAGPGGYVAAIRASQLGLEACVIEKDKAGGVCLNIGCIPSKALIHQAEVFSSIKELEAMGIAVDTSGFDYGKVWKKSRKAADTLSRGVQFLLKKNGIPLIQGTAKITGPHEVTLSGGDRDGERVTSRFILIATGSSPIRIPGFDVDEETILTSDGALMLEKLPRRLLIIGGGVIGCEIAHVMNTFGVEVTIVEMLDQLIPTEDADTADILAKSFKKRGIAIRTGTKASGYEKTKDGLTVSVEGKAGEKETLEVDKVLVVVGRKPNTAGIGLEEVGVELDRGFVRVGDYYRTTVESIFAVGDVTSSPLLAHVASKEGEIAVEHMAGHHPPVKADPDTIPAAVYTEPQIASFGLNERTAKERGTAYEKATFPYRGAGKSVAIDRTEGMVKVLVAPDTREILGAQVVGNQATELIHELLLAKQTELLPEDIATMIHAHPTLSEAVMEAMRASEGWVIHV